MTPFVVSLMVTLSIKLPFFYYLHPVLHSYRLTRLLMLASQNKSSIGVFNLGTVFFFRCCRFFMCVCRTLLDGIFNSSIRKYLKKRIFVLGDVFYISVVDMT